jgi:transcriptional regulator with XRE-family HTH domain
MLGVEVGGMSIDHAAGRGRQQGAGQGTPAAHRPGDLGRRAAQRRAELALTREQVADRAGMSVPYLEYLEHNPGNPPVAALWRLADALETTPSELLGSGAELPPGRRGPGPRPVLKRLTEAECLRLLTPGGVGRIAIITPSGPAVFPVNYVMAGQTVVFRTGASTVLAQHSDEQVGFEVDHLDEALAQGWSVLVSGQAHRVTDPAELAWLQENIDVSPWPGGDRETYVRIVPGRITGRRILAG